MIYNFDLCLTHSIIHHISEILDIAINHEDVALSTKAFTLLTTNNVRVVDEIFDSNLLNEKAEKLFKGQEYDLVTINRFALITQTCCIQSPDKALLNCSYLPQFLKFLHYRTVFEMFKEFFKNEENPKKIQSLLFDINFVPSLVELIRDAPDDLSENSDDEKVQMYVGLFQIIPIVQSSEILNETISSTDNIQIISRKFDHPSLAILNAQSLALASIINPQNSKYLVSIADRYFEELQDPCKPFHSYMESYIKIIQKLAINCNEFIQTLINWNIGEKFANLVHNHPSHTLLHLAINNFVSETVNLQELQDNLLPPLYAVANESLSTSNLPEFRAFGFYFQKTIHDQNVNFQQFEKFDDEAKSKIQNLTKIIDNNYGGEIPQPNDAQDNLNNLTLEQITALLRFVTGRR